MKDGGREREGGEGGRERDRDYRIVKDRGREEREGGEGGRERDRDYKCYNVKL